MTPRGLAAVRRANFLPCCTVTLILALGERTLLGVALCGINRGRARLIELVVEPGSDLPSIERRLLRRTLRNLRGLGERSLDFSAMGRDGVAAASVPSSS